MLKKYSQIIAPAGQELNNGPSQSTLDFILNYSKTTEVAKSKTKAITLFLN